MFIIYLKYFFSFFLFLFLCFRKGDLLVAWDSHALKECRERYHTYQYGMGIGSMQGRFVEGLLLGSKRGYFAVQRDTFVDWVSYPPYKEPALDWRIAQGSWAVLLVPVLFQDWQLRVLADAFFHEVGNLLAASSSFQNHHLWILAIRRVPLL